MAKMLTSFLVEKVISFAGCAAQMYSFIALETTECFLLAAVFYNRFVAIRNPLIYLIIMSSKAYVLLVIGSYIGGFLHSALHTDCTFSLTFSGYNEINHFYCDITPLFYLSCLNTSLTKLLLLNFVFFIEIIMVMAILTINSTRGKCQASSTCAGNLAAVSIYHGTILFMYLRPSSSYSLEIDKVITVFYTVMIPMMNPLIYSLRNQDVHPVLRKINRGIYIYS
ncbi:olfactory receptor 1102-like [Tachyglossus aculeatus]|uniref:olfactory receptor 1102-like n=1 Tax=Tachyglossus aculeatus TaxID=9261 RepID=UPI0018F6B0EF|nr:olfactory receptor 1102-like [Tachyglossus aculeatus]